MRCPPRANKTQKCSLFLKSTGERAKLCRAAPCEICDTVRPKAYGFYGRRISRNSPCRKNGVIPKNAPTGQCLVLKRGMPPGVMPYTWRRGIDSLQIGRSIHDERTLYKHAPTGESSWIRAGCMTKPYVVAMPYIVKHVKVYIAKARFFLSLFGTHPPGSIPDGKRALRRKARKRRAQVCRKGPQEKADCTSRDPMPVRRKSSSARSRDEK